MRTGDDHIVAHLVVGDVELEPQFAAPGLVGVVLDQRVVAHHAALGGSALLVIAAHRQTDVVVV